jgi:plastocyanin
MVSFFRSSLFPLLAIGGLVFIQACGGGDNGGGNGPTDPPTTGTLVVTVRADGSGLAGVTVNRFAPGGTTPASSSVTGSDGRATFSNLDPGSWEIEVVVPSQYELATGEDDRKSATVVAGATANVSFDLEDTFSGEVVEARDDLTFSQPNLVISAGTSVRWVNTGIMLHTVTPDGHSEWSAANLGSNGSTFTHTFDTPGTYEYFCEPHVESGMTGTVTVN